VHKSGKQRGYRCVFWRFGRKKREGRRLCGPGNPPPPRVFSQKRLQTVENKGRESGKERKERRKRRQLLVSKRVGTSESLNARALATLERVVHARGDGKYAQPSEKDRDIDATWRR